jgi:hypothetical protein
MSDDDTVRCFDSIESAQDFMKVLADTILDSMKDLSADQQEAVQVGEPRRAQAIDLQAEDAKPLHLQKPHSPERPAHGAAPHFERTAAQRTGDGCYGVVLKRALRNFIQDIEV